MTKALFVGMLFMTAFGLANPSDVLGYCTSEKLTQNLIGDWKGDDSYMLRIRKARNGDTCFTVVEPGTRIVRTVRDVLIRGGKLRHLVYYTASIDGYVVLMNIRLEDDEISFAWFSSDELRSGKDTYKRQPATPIKPRR